MELEKMSELEFVVKTAIQTKQPLGLLVEMPGFESPEMIVNPIENLEKKLEYWKKVYDDNLEHKNAKGIKIIAYTFC